ncbi:hypothetical protein [Nocardia sputorum]|nr:hypothetical protein [Nocardia sputorum]
MSSNGLFMLSEPLGDAVMQRHREPGAVEVAGEDVGVAAQLGYVAVAGRVQNLLDKADLIGI